MKELLKIFTIIILLISSIIGIIVLVDINTKNKVYAASNGSTNDLQLMARAINGEARGEPYEGQVAVRCSNIKSCKRFKISKYNSRSNIRKRCIYSSSRWSNKCSDKRRINSFKSCTRCNEWMGSNKWVYLLL